MSKGEVVANEVCGTAMPDADGSLNHQDLDYEGAVGAFLRDARLSQGMHISTLAGLLKVPVHKLHALEQGRFEALPDPVFTRALASSICRILKLDPAPVLRRLPAIATFKVAPQNRGINTPFRTRGSRNSVPLWNHISRPAIWIGLALVIGTLVLIFLPFIEREYARLLNAGQREVNPGQLAQPAAATTTVLTPVHRNADGVGGAENPVSGNSMLAEVPVAVPSPAMLPAPPSEFNAGATNPEPIITFTAKSASRVKLTDANGTVVFDRTLRAGESAGLSGTLPLAAVVGRANAVQVQVRGQAFDLGAVSRNNIAHFEVK